MVDVLSNLDGASEQGTMTYTILGLILLLLGFFHLFDGVEPAELKIVQDLQKISTRKTLLMFFKEIWFFGRTSFTLIILALLICFNWKVGGVAVGIFLVIIGIEYLFKTLYTRERPFTSQQNISMLQPLEPTDSSFPSGDTMRVWYLALVISAAAGSGTAILIAAATLAVLVTLGRMVMGVHFLTDTLAGAGLGILGAGATIYLWNLLNIV